MPLNERRARRSRVAPCGALAILGLLAAPAWSQNGKSVTCGGHTLVNPVNGFYGNFATPALIGTYGYPMYTSPGGGVGGDRNSTYYQLFYSISNAANIPCQLELVMVGTYPDARYFSLTDNDMHYSATEHLADFDVDPVSPSVTNPFLTGVTYTGNQRYLVPVSLGHIPNENPLQNPKFVPGCGVTTFEEDNLLDATQRHLSMDWNTDLVDDNTGTAHVVDMPTHLPGTGATGNAAGPNTAGSLTVRSYLSPETCTGALGSGAVTCTAPDPPAQPYMIVRDAQTGCAYPISAVIANGWLDDPLYTTTACKTGQYGSCINPTAAVISTEDRAASAYGGYAGWNDESQHDAHTLNTDLISQACYANGGPSAAMFPNRVAWVRSPEWLGSPGPDDSYIGGAVPSTDLTSVVNGTGCNAKQGQSCVMRFRFQVPPNLADTPCVAPFNCSLSGNEQLRYMSLTFEYQTGVTNPAKRLISDPDGLTSTGLPNPPSSVISLADVAFKTTPDGSGNYFATLLVNVGGTLPAWLQQTAAGVSAQVAGVFPPTPQWTPENPTVPGNYSVWLVNGYTVLDLSQFTAFNTNVCPGATCVLPLLLNIRNTLPGATFACSGTSVPFSTALFTNIDGSGSNLMGPYVPLVDYRNPNDQNQGDPYYLPTQAGTGGLPSASYCGRLPGTSRPGATPWGVSVNYPTQFWPGASSGALNCTSLPTPAEPSIAFISTQRTTTAATGNTTDCTQAADPCTQVVAQKPQDQSEWVPPMQLKITGSGFGFLAQASLPLAATKSTYLEVASNGAGSGHPWDTNNSPWEGTGTATCQIYIASWTDTGISLVLGLPSGVTNSLANPLSPPDDLSFTTFFFPGPPTSPKLPCPIEYPDQLTFTVTNPQLVQQKSATPSVQKTVSVLPYNTTPN